MARNINYQVNLTVNKSGLDELLLSLKQIQQEQIKALNLGTLTSELDKAGDAAHKLEQILNKSWNSKIGQLDLSRLNNEIKTTYGSIDKLKNNLEAVGMGQYFNKLQSNILNTNLQLKQSNKLLDEMATSMSNTIKWGITSSIFNNITNQIQKAWSYSKALDTSLNSIRIVTGKSADEMERYARVANKAAKELGQSTRDYTDASLIYYQQGLGDEEAQARTETTLKAANVTGQTGQEVSEQLTAVWNGYKVSAAETELYVDKLAAVAASTASDLEELSTGMSKVASAANSAGIDIDQLNGILSTVISVTREAPETIGSSFKTIFARLGDLALDGEDEYGVTLGKVSSQMEQLGIEVLNQKGEMRDMGDIIEDTAAKWQTWTQAQKQAAAVAMAGKMQYSRLIALFDNWDKYSTAVQTSQNAIGTLQEQQDIYMESTEAHLQKLSTEAERTYDILFDTDSVNDMSDAMTSLLKIFNNFLAGMGGGLSSITGLTAIAGNLFNKQIGAGIAGIVQNRQVGIQNQQAVDTAMAFSQTAASQTSSEAEGAVYEQMRLKSQEILALKEKISTEEMNNLLTLRQKAEQESLLAASLQEQYDRQTSMVSIENSLKNQTKLIKEQKQEYAAITQDVQIMDNNRGTRYVEERNQMLNAQRDILSRISIMKDEELLTDEQIAILEKAKQRDSQNRILTEKQISDLQNISQQVIEQEVQKEKEITRQKELQQQLDNGTLDAQKIKAQQNQQALADYQTQLQRQTAIQDMVKGLTTLITLGTTLSGIWKTLNNEELSGWEKFSQISSTLLFTLPMLITNFTSIAKILPGINAMVGATATGTKVLGSSALAATVTIHGLKLAMWEVYLIIAAVIAIVSLLVVGIKALVDAYNADAIAAEKAAEAARELTSVYEDTKTANEELKKSISEYNDGVKALKELEEGTDEYKDALEKANAKAKELIETYKLFDEYTIDPSSGLIEIDPEALNKVESKADYQLQTAESSMAAAQIRSSFAQVESETTNLARELKTVTISIGNFEDELIAVQIPNDDLQQAASALNELKEANEDEYDIITSSTESLSKFLNESNKVPESIKNYLYWNNEEILGLVDLAEALEKATGAAEYYASKITGEIVEDLYSDRITQMATDEEGNFNKEYAEFLKNAGAAQTKFITDALEKTIGEIDYSKITSNSSLEGWLSGLAKSGYNSKYKDTNFNDKETALAYAELTYGVNRSELTYKGGNGKGTVYQAGKTEPLFEETNDEFMRQQIARIEMNNALKQKAKESGQIQLDNLYNALDKLPKINWDRNIGANLTEAIQKSVLNDTTKLDFSEILSQISPEEYFANSSVANLGQVDNGATLLNMLGLTETDIKALGWESGKDFAQNFAEALNQWDIKDWYNRIGKAASQGSKDATTLMEGIQSGDITYENIAESDEYKDLQEQLEEVKDAGIDVVAETEILNKTWLVGTQEYIEALEKVQDKLYQLQIESLTHEAEELANTVEEEFNKITDDDGNIIVDADTTAFTSAMEDLLDKEYEIDVAIHTEAEQEFDSIINALNDIHEKASLIGDEYKVSAENVRELNNTFPGILENMTILKDGTVQLNSDIVKSAMETAEAETQADAQATIQKLQNQATLLRQKQAVYQQMANAALILAQGEEATEEEKTNAIAALNGSLNELEQINNELTSQQEIDNAVAVADSSNTNAQAVAKNWESAYQGMADASYQAASIAINNMNAVESGGSPTKGKVSANYQGTTGKSSDATIAETTRKAIDIEESGTGKTDWSKLASQYAQLANSAGAAANDIDGMIAQIGAQAKATDYGLGGVSKGLGSDNKKDNSGSKNEPDKMDVLEDEKDRYHDIDIILKQISTDLDRLDKQKDKLFGKDLLDNLNKQLQTLDRQIDATNEKIRIAQGEAAELRNKLSRYGTTFNADGTIANYTQVYQSQLNYVNSLIAQYNSMSKEQQEAFKDTVETAKENFDKFTEAINNYDTLISDTIPGLQDEIQDAIDKEIEIKIEEFTMEIEIRLDLSEAERDWNEFRRKVIDEIKDDDILGNTKARLRDFSSYYKADETGEVQALTQQVLNTEAQLEQMDKTGTSDWYGDNRAKALENLKSYTDQLMESLGDVEDLVQEIKDSYLDMMDEAAEKFGDQIDLYEQVRDIITHDMNVIELIYGEESYKDLEKYYEKQEENYNKQLDFNRQQKDFWYNQMIAIEKAGGKNSEAWLKAKENWMSAVNEWNSAIEEAIENLQNKYQNAINLIFQGLNDKVTNGLGLEYVSEEWELINQNADQYLDTINSLYGIQDLENKYLDAIDNTDSISAQQKLNELMEEEVAALKEKDKLTQYDIDRANMKYEIALKQIALEEAQQNKSTMRLRRDSQGNYTYQYVADNDQVGQIEDELSALKNELYNFDLEHYRDNLDQVLSIYTEFQEKMAEAALINDPEERQERELLLREQYGELINGLVEQNEDIRTNLHESAFTELADLYGIEYANFQQLSEDEKTVMMEQMIPQWDSAVQHMTDTFAGNDEGEGGFLPTCRDAFKQLDEATKQYQTDLGELQQSAGTDFDNIRNGIDENIGKTQELITNNDELIRSYQDQLSAIGAVISELQQLVSQYNAARDAAIAATEAAYGYWKAQQQQAANAAGKNVSSGGSNSNSVNSNSNSNNNNSGGSGSSSVESGGGASVGNKITYSGKYYYDSFGTSPAGSKYSGVADGVTIDIVNNNPYGIHVKSSDGKYPDLGWIKKSQVTRWNTGGYTGDWGDDSGRLAILDRKELVLNKEDTPNILNAVEIMRGIANSMNLSMLSRMAGSINGVQNSSNSIAADSDTLEQNVHIDATFPGVKDAREIEQALNNLVNVASQRIGHNRR